MEGNVDYGSKNVQIITAAYVRASSAGPLVRVGGHIMFNSYIFELVNKHTVNVSLTVISSE